MSRAVVLVVALAIAGLVPGVPARAQAPGAATDDGWVFGLTPYVWFPSFEGDVAPSGNVPTADVDASFSDIIDQTNFALMLKGEARRERLGLLVDVDYLDLSDDGDTPGPLFGDLELKSKAAIGTAALAYEILRTERFSLELAAGARAWLVDIELDLSPGLAGGRTDQENELWVDPIVAARWHGRLGNGFFLLGEADYGGFGVGSDETWQVIGTVGYDFANWLSARGGYRHLSVDYDDDVFVWDVDLSGPIVGVTMLF